MPGKNLAMGRQGSQFTGDGINLSWPFGGQREVSPKPEYLSTRIQLRIANGYIVETDEDATIELPVDEGSRVLYGEDARRVFDEPPKQVVVRAQVRTYDPKPEVDVRLKGAPVQSDAGGTVTAVMENIPVKPRGALTPPKKRG